MLLLQQLLGGKATRAELYGTAGVLLVIAAGGISYAAVAPGSSSTAGTTTTTAGSATSVGTPDSVALAPSDGGTALSTTTLPAGPSTTTTAPPTTTTVGNGVGSPVPTTIAPVPTPTTAPFPPPTGPGTADLTYSGAVSGTLLDAVSYCQPRPGASSEITVNGTLNGTPWVLFIIGYVGGDGAYSVITGQAGGGTGMAGSGWEANGSYPTPVGGVTQIDWAHGATLDGVQMALQGSQAPPSLTVSGTIDCG